MAFIFTAENDPRREHVATFEVDAKVKVRGMNQAGTVLSGPHKSPGHDRYLVRKADGNISLIKSTELEKAVPRIDIMAGTLAIVLYGRSYVSLDYPTRMKISRVAARALVIADATQGQD
jgi:hypothetical protein